MIDGGMKQRIRVTSFAIALASSFLVVLLTFLYWRDVEQMARLSVQNESERIMNSLFDGLKNSDTFGEAIESNADLQKEIVGIAVYARDGSSVYSWGDCPSSYPAGASGSLPDGREGRIYLEKPSSDAVVLLMRSAPMGPRPPPEQRGLGAGAGNGRMDSQQRGPKFFDTLRKGDFTYLELRQAGYWTGKRARLILFPAIAAILIAGVFFVRSTVLRNAEYRKRIEEQKNLVILGTAASTLAHEIKTPLQAIRLQTSILERLYPGQAARELGIISEETERLSQLSYRVNDYLRDPRGNPEPVSPSSVAEEVSQRFFNRSVVADSSGGARALVDAERLRSVLENLLRNAAESGGPEEGIAIEVSAASGRVTVDVLDRGRGVDRKDRDKLFQAFFTTKSRGSGIGLAICQRFISGAGGTIGLSDRPGGGTRARVELPEAKA